MYAACSLSEREDPESAGVAKCLQRPQTLRQGRVGTVRHRCAAKGSPGGAAFACLPSASTLFGAGLRHEFLPTDEVDFRSVRSYAYAPRREWPEVLGGENPRLAYRRRRCSPKRSLDRLSPRRVRRGP